MDLMGHDRIRRQDPYLLVLEKPTSKRKTWCYGNAHFTLILKHYINVFLLILIDILCLLMLFSLSLPILYTRFSNEDICNHFPTVVNLPSSPPNDFAMPRMHLQHLFRCLNAAHDLLTFQCETLFDE